MKPIAGEGQFPFNGDGFCITGAKINGVTHEGGFNIHQQRSDCVFDLINRSTKEIVQYVQMVAHDQYAQVLSTAIPTATLVQTIPDNSFFVKTVRTDGGKDSFVTAFQNNLIKLVSGERLYKPWPLIECAGGDDIEDFEFNIEPAVHGWVGDEVNISVLSKISKLNIPGEFTYNGEKVSVLELLEHAIKLKRLVGGYHNLSFKPKDGRKAISLDITNYVDKADKLVAVMFDNECTHGFQVYGSRHIKKEMPLYIQLVSEPEWFSPREPILPDNYDPNLAQGIYPILKMVSDDNKTYMFEAPKLGDDNLMDSGYISYSVTLDAYLVNPNDEIDNNTTLNVNGNYGMMLHGSGDSYLRFPDYTIEIEDQISQATANGKTLSGPIRLGKTLNLRVSSMHGFSSVPYAPTAPDKSLWRWRSSDPSVASIDNYGKVTTHKEGQTKIDFYFEGYPELTYIPGYDGTGTQILTVLADAPETFEWTPKETFLPISVDESGGTKLSIHTLPDREEIPITPPLIYYPNEVKFNPETSVIWFTKYSEGYYEYYGIFNQYIPTDLFPSPPSASIRYSAEFATPRPPTPEQQINPMFPYGILTFGRGIDVMAVDLPFYLTLPNLDGSVCELLDPDNILTKYDRAYYEMPHDDQHIVSAVPHSAGSFQLHIKYPSQNIDRTYTIKVLPVPKI